ncbi:MAG: hypothetical protein KC912_25810 [Proteobacteria bacterium]|nr:hypothetical protein [Pseudomonadota bacterium]
MSKRRRSMFGKSGTDSGDEAPKDEAPFSVPDAFDEDELPPDPGTEERLRKALEGDVVEVSEKVSSHNFIRSATEDTGDDAWDNSIHANRRADGSYVEDEPEAEAEAEAAPVPLDTSIEPAADVPDFFAVGSVDSDNPISFVGDVLGGEPTPPPVVAFGEEPAEPAEEPIGFLGAGSDEPPMPLEATGEAFFGGAPQPPTEEVPTAILEDLTQPSSIPSMSGGVGYEAVPEPTIQEEVIGAPTPSPVVRMDEPEPPDLRKRLAAKAKETYDDQDDDDDDFELPIVPLAILAVLLVVAAGAVFGIARLVMGPDLEQAEQAAISVEVKPPVEIPTATLPDVMRPGEPRDIPSGTVEVDPMARPPAVPTAEAGTAGTAPRPKAKPRRAAPAPKADPQPSSGLSSKITVTSNRRVLVHLDGQPQGYAPLEIMVGAGTYSVSASLPGRGETEQIKTVEVGRKSIKRIGFIF